GRNPHRFDDGASAEESTPVGGWSMVHQVLLHDLFSEAEDLRILGVDDSSDPMRIRIANGLYPREVFNGSPARGAEQGFVDAKDVRIPMHVHDRLAERHGLLLQHRQELVEA